MQPQLNSSSETWSHTYPDRDTDEVDPPDRFANGTETMKVARIDVEDPDPGRLDLAEDAHLTMQLKAIKRGRGWILAAITTSFVALGAGIALVL
jgi:hypothetical protein